MLLSWWQNGEWFQNRHSLRTQTRADGSERNAFSFFLFWFPYPLLHSPHPPTPLLPNLPRSQFPYFGMSNSQLFLHPRHHDGTKLAFVVWCLVAGIFSFDGKAQILCFRRRSLKVKLLCTLWRRIRGEEMQLHPFLTFESDGGERSTSLSCCFISGKEP